MWNREDDVQYYIIRCIRNNLHTCTCWIRVQIMRTGDTSLTVVAGAYACARTINTHTCIYASIHLYTMYHAWSFSRALFKERCPFVSSYSFDAYADTPTSPTPNSGMVFVLITKRSHLHDKRRQEEEKKKRKEMLNEIRRAVAFKLTCTEKNR